MFAGIGAAGAGADAGRAGGNIIGAADIDGIAAGNGAGMGMTGGKIGNAVGIPMPKGRGGPIIGIPNPKGAPIIGGGGPAK